MTTHDLGASACRKRAEEIEEAKAAITAQRARLKEAKFQLFQTADPDGRTHYRNIVGDATQQIRRLERLLDATPSPGHRNTDPT